MLTIRLKLKDLLLKTITSNLPLCISLQIMQIFYLHQGETQSLPQEPEAKVWVNKLSKFADDLPIEDRISFLGYFSNNQNLIPMGLTKNILLPLIDEEIVTPAMVRHCMSNC